MSIYRQVGRSWLRLDAFGSVWVLNSLDQSREVRGIHGNYPGSEYNSECSCCWLGFAHSLELHTDNLRKAGKAA